MKWSQQYAQVASESIRRSSALLNALELPGGQETLEEAIHSPRLHFHARQRTLRVVLYLDKTIKHSSVFQQQSHSAYDRYCVALNGLVNQLLYILHTEGHVSFEIPSFNLN